MALVARHRDTPGEGRARDGKVAQSLADKGQDLVAPALGLDEIGDCLDMGQELLLVLAHAEEIGLLLELLRRPVAVGALEVDELCLGPERFAGGAVPVLVFPQVDVALGHDP